MRPSFFMFWHKEYRVEEFKVSDAVRAIFAALKSRGATEYRDERGIMVIPHVDKENRHRPAYDGLTRCVASSVDALKSMLDEYGKECGAVCVMNAPENISDVFSDCSAPYRTFVYLDPMPPAPSKIKGGGEFAIKRLASSLAETVHDRYGNPGGYTVDDIADIIRNGDVFGAILDGRLAGFIGRHMDGSMGMLEVFEPYRKRGIGEALERFMMTYVMTFGTAPFCEVDLHADASLCLQSKLGLTALDGYTIWHP